MAKRPRFFCNSCEKNVRRWNGYACGLCGETWAPKAKKTKGGTPKNAEEESPPSGGDVPVDGAGGALVSVGAADPAPDELIAKLRGEILQCRALGFPEGAAEREAKVEQLLAQKPRSEKKGWHLEAQANRKLRETERKLERSNKEREELRQRIADLQTKEAQLSQQIASQEERKKTQEKELADVRASPSGPAGALESIIAHLQNGLRAAELGDNEALAKQLREALAAAQQEKKLHDEKVAAETPAVDEDMALPDAGAQLEGATASTARAGKGAPAQRLGQKEAAVIKTFSPQALGGELAKQLQAAHGDLFEKLGSIGLDPLEVAKQLGTTSAKLVTDYVHDAAQSSNKRTAPVATEELANKTSG